MVSLESPSVEEQKLEEEDSNKVNRDREECSSEVQSPRPVVGKGGDESLTAPDSQDGSEDAASCNEQEEVKERGEAASGSLTTPTATPKRPDKLVTGGS